MVCLYENRHIVATQRVRNIRSGYTTSCSTKHTNAQGNKTRQRLNLGCHVQGTYTMNRGQAPGAPVHEQNDGRHSAASQLHNYIIINAALKSSVKSELKKTHLKDGSTTSMAEVLNGEVMLQVDISFC